MKVKLGSFIKIMQGYAFKTKNYVKKSKFRLVTLGNFAESGNCFKYNNEKAIFYGADFPSKVILQEGDLILPLTEQVVGLFGNSAFVPNGDGFQFVLNQRVGKVILVNDKINMNFLHYLLATDTVKKQLEARANGTKQRNISPDDIYDVLVDLPNINLQKKIGNLFYNIEKKQKINNQINTQLEELAKTIYDYWFLQFEFPNEEGKPYKSSGGKMVYNEQLKREIPEGWEVNTIQHLSTLVSGYPFKTKDFIDNGKYKIYTIKNVQDGYVNNEVDNTIDFLPNDINDDCILKCGDLIMSLTGNVARVGLVYEKDVLLNQRVLKIKVKDDYFNYIYLTFRQNSFKNTMQKIAGGTSQKNLSPNQVGDYKIVIPNQNVLKSFNKKLKNFFNVLTLNLKENQQLSSLRDFLLPLLMNGQVTFKDENEEVENKVEKFVSPKRFDKFNQWKQMQGYAARGEADDEILKKIYDAMDEDDKK